MSGGKPEVEAKSLKSMTSNTCQICGDEVGFLEEGNIFVACGLCAYPLCRTCYEYETKEGDKSCPQCNKRYRQHKGASSHSTPQVDAENESDIQNDVDNDNSSIQGDSHNKRQITETKLHWKMAHDKEKRNSSHSKSQELHSTQIPCITNRELISRQLHCTMENQPMSTTPIEGGGKDVHPVPYPGALHAVHAKSGEQARESHFFGLGNIAWKERVDSWRKKQMKNTLEGADSAHYSSEVKDQDLDGDYTDDEEDVLMNDEARQPLSRKVSLPSSKINPYRMVIVLRLVILCFFFRYRILNPVRNAYALWFTSIICEIWFGVSWILDQFPKWSPINRETYLDRLSLRYDVEGELSQLAPIDCFVSTVDPMKEPPLVTANTVLSILSVDYPVNKVSCYVSDDGASMLTFEALTETSEFARKWVPFCKKFNIEPRAPEFYFSQNIDKLKNKVHLSFVKERRVMKREYEEFKVRINAFVAKAQKVPDEGWIMQDGTPWPGNNTRDHPGMIQVFLGHNGGLDTDGNELPRLVYVSREKRPGFLHHKKAGAMNALVRVSGVLTNGPFILNLDCDHYINNSKALREAMCFMMDPTLGNKVCYVQFPQRFDGIDKNDRYANRNTVFFDINLRGLDGVQGPVYVGTGCVFNREALYGYDPPIPLKKSSFSLCCGQRKKSKALNKKNDDSKIIERPAESVTPIYNLEDIEGVEDYEDENSLHTSQNELEQRFGQCSVFVASTLIENGGVPESASPSELLKEAIHVISCGYEDKTYWGKEIGWIYGSVTEDILTGFKMHARGWRSIYCMPPRPAFKGSAPINLSDRLNQVLRWALGSIEILFSRHCPIWYGYQGNLKWLERLAYINTTIYPITSLPLIVYCTLPAVCLLTGRFIINEISTLASLWFLSLFISIFATSILEMRWSGVGIDEWWRNEQFWVIGGVSAHFFAVIQGLLKVFAGIDTNFTVTSKASDENGEFSELYVFKWTSLLIPPTTLLVINLVGVVAGISSAINTGFRSWGPLFGKLFFAFWVIIHLYPFLKGIMGGQNRMPTIVVVWSILLASIFSLLWVRIDPFTTKVRGPDLQLCGINC